jgi:hypothetical protein
MVARPKEHLLMQPFTKYEIFKAAYDRVNLYKEKKDFLAAHVLSFSILEDRVTAAYVVVYRLMNREDPPKYESLGKLRFKDLLDLLLRMGVLKIELHQRLLSAAYKRNELLHEMMWRLNAFNSKNVDEIRSLIIEVEKMTRNYVKLHGTKKDLSDLAE